MIANKVVAIFVLGVYNSSIWLDQKVENILNVLFVVRKCMQTPAKKIEKSSVLWNVKIMECICWLVGISIGTGKVVFVQLGGTHI
jgi:hypothetical protein